MTTEDILPDPSLANSKLMAIEVSGRIHHERELLYGRLKQLEEWYERQVRAEHHRFEDTVRPMQAMLEQLIKAISDYEALTVKPTTIIFDKK